MPPCEFKGCTRQARFKKGGLCVAHAKQRVLGKELRPLLERMSCSGPCLFEGCEMPRLARGLCAGHYQQQGKGRELTPLLVRKPCGVAWCERSTLAEVCKWHGERLRRYGVTAEHLNQLYRTQGGGCAICGGGPGKRDWHIDHDHTCCPARGRACGGCVRGLLCGSCNLMLGHAKDSLSRLIQGAEYLEKWSSPPVDTANVTRLIV